MKQKSLIGLLSTVAVVVGMWACGDSSSTEPDDTASSSSSSEEKSISSESSAKDEKSESSSSSETSSSSTGSSSVSEIASSSDKTESSSSSEVSSSSDKNESSSSSEASSSSSESESSSSSELSSSSDEAESSSSSSEEEIIDCSGKNGLDTLSATLIVAENVIIRRIYDLSVMVDGKKRTFMMTVPEAYKGDKPVPLIVDYHANGGSGSGQYKSTTYKTQTEPEGVISLYPDGVHSQKAMGTGWNLGPCCGEQDDVAFTREMIAAVEEMVCIDKKRVYATGFSMGGGMAHQAACSMSDIFAAVATAGMDLNKTNSAKCEPERPIPVIMFRGTGDPVCRYQGGDSGYNDGLNFLGAEGSFRFWAEKDGCTDEPTTNSDGCKEYSNCKDGTKVVLCTNMGTPDKEGNTNGHSQGKASIGWPFLKQFTLP